MRKIILATAAFVMFSALSLDTHYISPNPALAGGGGGASTGSQYIELDPLILPIVDGNGISQTVSVVVAIDVPDASVADNVKIMIPKLKDAYIQDLYGALSRHAAMKGGVLQVGMLKERLNEITHKVMGEHKINEVLLQVVQQRPI